MPRRILRLIPLLGLVLAPSLSGCVLAQITDGTELDAARLEEIVVGQTTRAEVGRLLGTPDEIIYSNFEHDPLFERAYDYRRTRIKNSFFTIVVFSTARTDENSDHVLVFFDDDGVVEDVAIRLDMDKPEYGAPWKE